MVFYLPVSESPPSLKPNTETESPDSSQRTPIILITAPSRDDIYATPSKITIADAIKEQRPGSAPFVVGKKLPTRQ